MPLNSTTYLESHGWEGKGVPLDGKQGRGLKKPLALPMKRNLKGLGKDRDRAVEWWDCLFEASAKSISIRVDDKRDDIKTSAVIEKIESSPKGKRADVKNGCKISLESQAKRELARKMLMSGFVRGKEIKKTAAEEELEQKLMKQQEERQAKLKRSAQQAIAVKDVIIDSKESEIREGKEDKARRRLARQLRRAEKEAKKKKKRKDANDGKTVKEISGGNVAEIQKTKVKKKRRSDVDGIAGGEVVPKSKKRKRKEVQR